VFYYLLSGIKVWIDRDKNARRNNLPDKLRLKRNAKYICGPVKDNINKKN
jgi:hypothetical protein